MKDLVRISEVNMAVTNRPRLITDPVEKTYPKGFKFISLTRWLARWYKCFSYHPKKQD